MSSLMSCEDVIFRKVLFRKVKNVKMQKEFWKITQGNCTKEKDYVTIQMFDAYVEKRDCYRKSVNLKNHRKVNDTLQLTP